MSQGVGVAEQKFASAQTRGSISINASQTVTVDTIPSGSGNAVRWLFSVLQTVSEDFLEGEISARKKGTDVKHSHVLVGDQVDYDLDVVEDSGAMKLNITNNEAETLDIKFIRFLI
jgi:hypothetical protein